MNAFVVLRVSTPHQAEHGYSLSREGEVGVHEEKCRQFCQLKGWPVVGVYVDAGVTGRRTGAAKRCGLEKGITVACTDKGVLVIYSISRLGRSASYIHNMADRLEDAGASIASATETVIDTTTAMGRAFFGLCAVFAQLESDQISERVKAAYAYRKRQMGFSTMGSQPFECYLDPVTKQRIRDDEALAAIEVCRQVRNEVFARGGPWSEVAATLNARGVLTPTAVKAKRRNSFAIKGGEWTIDICKYHCEPKHRWVKQRKPRKMKYPFKEAVC